jgi:hypothetical protein
MFYVWMACHVGLTQRHCEMEGDAKRHHAEYEHGLEYWAYFGEYGGRIHADETKEVGLAAARLVTWKATETLLVEVIVSMDASSQSFRLHLVLQRASSRPRIECQ